MDVHKILSARNNGQEMVYEGYYLGALYTGILTTGVDKEDAMELVFLYLSLSFLHNEGDDEENDDK